MPGRKMPLITNEFYHVFNRGINRQPTFIRKQEYQRATDTISFYRFASPPVRLSKFIGSTIKQRDDILQVLEKRDILVEILCYCFMPNHFHLLLKQRKTNGISRFLSNVQNSYTRFFNVKHRRDGPLFLGQFKAIRIETEEQLIHVSRYIHLNPYTGYVVKTINALETYPWSSFSNYIKNVSSFLEANLLLGLLQNTERYKRFVFDQADYQRKLNKIEHLLLE